jgi:hypothetical protein
MNEVKEITDNLKMIIRESKSNISVTKDAIKALKKVPLSAKDKLTIEAYKKSIAWNRQQIKDSRNSLRIVKMKYGKNYWTWIILITFTVILALLFPISIFTFAPIWGTLLIGWLYIMVSTGR